MPEPAGSELSPAGVALGVAVAFVLALVLARRLADRPLSALMDVPNERSLHAVPTPRSGGLAILAGLAAALAALAGAGLTLPGAPWLAAGAAIVVAVSLVDDFSHVNKGIRLALHLAAAWLALRGGLAPARLDLPGITIPLGPGTGVALGMLATAWMVNVYNFMDGMDGFAGGMAVIGFGTLAALAALAGDAALAAPCACIAAAAGGFLVPNFPPARIFMGDLGSSLLGFLAAVGILAADARGVAPLWVGALVFSPFLVDATVTLVRRVVRGEPFWRAHKSHYYQRLVESGWGHLRTVLAGYVLMAAAALSALAAGALGPAGQAVLLVAWLLAYTIGVAAIARAQRRGGKHGPDAAA